MIADPAALAGLVTREVRTGSRAGATTRIAVARRLYPTDQADLWDAVTNAERIPRWFVPVSGELVLGGHYQLEGNAGGVVERCEAPSEFAVTWEMGPMVSWLEVTLSAVDDGTVLELVHEAPVDPEMWGQYGPGAVGVGWDLCLLGVGMYVAGDAVPNAPAEADAFRTSVEGTEFIRRSGAGWREAAIADGDEADAAREAAERTIAAYTAPVDGHSS
ncbi:SRPBCC family protein [Solirubrobacter ginsenosidimutans]|uniref:SRPBCC family protein n=1 Tax=Solirubrobacter ginsenosidimutans TaxID=490573 RepID=A0A9X3S1Y4_9ACTN|nr:SRPBCC family protein [Solirubrobacter ginsenosidimutans]MDA0160606.1 SRPBCC family protein [Solirubrobacter ginsenosidimutans]